MRLIAPTALAALVLLAACSPKPRPAVVEEMEVTAEPATGPADDPACLSGDDGIGGTGCKLD